MADSNAPPKSMMGLAPSLNTPGFRLVDAGELYALLNSLFSIQQGITARGTTAATGFKLTAGVNNLTTVTPTNNAVVLPPGLPGKQVIISNNNVPGTAAAVFASGADQIIPIGSPISGASVAQAGGTSSLYVCVSRTFNPTVAVWKQITQQ